MKKFVSVFCAAVLLLCAVSIPASAKDKWYGPGKSIEFSLNGGILYFADMGDYLMLYDSENLQGDVVIPDKVDGKPVTTLYYQNGPVYQGCCYDCFSWGNPEMVSLTLPASLKEFRFPEDSSSCFLGEENLKEVIFLGDGPETLPRDCFVGAVNLERVVLPKKVKEMDGAFFHEVKEIVLDPANPYFVKDEQGVIYTRDKTKLVTAAEGAAERTELTIPDTVTEVVTGAIRPNIHLQKIYGGAQVKKVDGLSASKDLNPFSDTYGHWSEEYAKWAFQEGLFSGVTAFSFGPDSEVTRGMLAAVLYRLEGSPDMLWGRPFPDVPANSYYAKAIRWTSEKGIAYGYSANQFAPNDSVTREQMASMLYRYAKLKGEVSPSGDLSAFTDADKVHDWALEAMQWAVGEGIVSGMGNGTLNPRGTATRAEVAAVLKHFTEL